MSEHIQVKVGINTSAFRTGLETMRQSANNFKMDNVVGEFRKLKSYINGVSLVFSSFLGGGAVVGAVSGVKQIIETVSELSDAWNDPKSKLREFSHEFANLFRSKEAEAAADAMRQKTLDLIDANAAYNKSLEESSQTWQRILDKSEERSLKSGNENQQIATLRRKIADEKTTQVGLNEKDPQAYAKSKEKEQKHEYALADLLLKKEQEINDERNKSYEKLRETAKETLNVVEGQKKLKSDYELSKVSESEKANILRAQAFELKQQHDTMMKIVAAHNALGTGTETEKTAQELKTKAMEKALEAFKIEEKILQEKKKAALEQAKAAEDEAKADEENALRKMTNEQKLLYFKQKQRDLMKESEMASASGDELTATKKRTEAKKLGGTIDELSKPNQSDATLVASSLASVGGGGRVMNLGANAMQKIAEKQLSILERIAENTKGGKGGEIDMSAK